MISEILNNLGYESSFWNTILLQDGTFSHYMLSHWVLFFTIVLYLRHPAKVVAAVVIFTLFYALIATLHGSWQHYVFFWSSISLGSMFGIATGYSFFVFSNFKIRGSARSIYMYGIGIFIIWATFLCSTEVIHATSFPLGLLRTFLGISFVSFVFFLTNFNENEIATAWNNSIYEYYSVNAWWYVSVSIMISGHFIYPVPRRSAAWSVVTARESLLVQEAMVLVCSSLFTVLVYWIWFRRMYRTEHHKLKIDDDNDIHTLVASPRQKQDPRRRHVRPIGDTGKRTSEVPLQLVDGTEVGPPPFFSEDQRHRHYHHQQNEPQLYAGAVTTRGTYNPLTIPPIEADVEQFTDDVERIIGSE